jgi:hypothetical protein
MLGVDLVGQPGGDEGFTVRLDMPFDLVSTFLRLTSLCCAGEPVYRALFPQLSCKKGSGKRECMVRFGSQCALLGQEDPVVCAGVLYSGSRADPLIAVTPLAFFSRGKSPGGKIQLYPIDHIDEKGTRKLKRTSTAEEDGKRSKKLHSIYSCFPGFEKQRSYAELREASEEEEEGVGEEEGEDEEESEQDEEEEEVRGALPGGEAKRKSEHVNQGNESSGGEDEESSESAAALPAAAQTPNAKRRRVEIFTPQTPMSCPSSSSDNRSGRGGSRGQKRRREEQKKKRGRNSKRRTEMTLEDLQGTLMVRWVLCHYLPNSLPVYGRQPHLNEYPPHTHTTPPPV